jgi:opacity protein-like surface antigen
MNKYSAITLFLIKAIILLLMASLVTNTYAQEKELSVFTGYRVGGEFEDINTGATVKIDEGSSYSVVFDSYLDEYSAIEVLYSYQPTNLKPGGTFSGSKIFNLDIEYFHIGGIRFYPDEKVTKYVVGTIGATHMSPSRGGLDSETRFSLGLGGGLKMPLTKKLALRVEGRGYGTLFSSDSAVFCSNGGCNVHVAGSAFWQFEVSAGLSLKF